jgi:thiosulfate reductase cytochrome b subunit
VVADNRARLVIGQTGVDDCMGEMAKIIIVIGIVLVLTGLAILFFQKVPFLGKLPGDILIQKKNFTFYLPFSTSIVVSIIVSLILCLISKFR